MPVSYPICPGRTPQANQDLSLNLRRMNDQTMPKTRPKTTANIATCCQLSIDDSQNTLLNAIPPNGWELSCPPALALLHSFSDGLDRRTSLSFSGRKAGQLQRLVMPIEFSAN